MTNIKLPKDYDPIKNREITDRNEFWDSLSKSHEETIYTRQMMEIVENFIKYPYLINSWNKDPTLHNQVIKHYKDLQEIVMEMKPENRNIHLRFVWTTDFNGVYEISESLLQSLGWNSGEYF